MCISGERASVYLVYCTISIAKDPLNKRQDLDSSRSFLVRQLHGSGLMNQNLAARKK